MECRCDGVRFEAVEGERVVGRLDYTEEGDSIAMNRTIVPPELSGRGIGTRLTAYALQYADDNGWTVLPYCTFVQSYIGSHPEFLHLVPQHRRSEFSL